MRRPAAMIVVRVVACLLAPTALTGCFKVDRLPARVDRWSFLKVGGTLFANPESLTLKEIHLDTGTLHGREVIVQGKVAEVSQHGTYLVLRDDAARMLVVLTEMEGARPLLEGEKPKALRVLGTVESGKKGLPFVKARSFNVVDEAALAVPPPTT